MSRIHQILFFTFVHYVCLKYVFYIIKNSPKIEKESDYMRRRKNVFDWIIRCKKYELEPKKFKHFSKLILATLNSTLMNWFHRLNLNWKKSWIFKVQSNIIWNGAFKFDWVNLGCKASCTHSLELNRGQNYFQRQP